MMSPRQRVLWPESRWVLRLAGRDGSRAFVTGKFDDVGLIDDVADMTDEQIFSILSGSIFTRRRKILVGYVEGLPLTQRARKQNTTWPWCHVWMHTEAPAAGEGFEKTSPLAARWASGEGTRIGKEGGCHASGI